jgi:cytochrome P450
MKDICKAFLYAASCRLTFASSIPKGSSVVGFSQVLTRDPTFFPDPEVLRPERFLDPKTGDINKLPVYSFGFGRR